MRTFFLLCLVWNVSQAAVFFPAAVASGGGGSGSLDVTLPNLATTTGTNPPTSRTSCVSPCAVYFDAQGTTSSLTTNPFMELLFNWDFGDVVSGAAGSCSAIGPIAREQGEGSYCTGVITGNPNALQPVDSKNFAKGPQAAHVFECLTTSPTYSAGFCTYTVTLRASQGNTSNPTTWEAAEYKSTTTTITVEEADHYYGTLTLCVDNGATTAAGSDGCPSTAYATGPNSSNAISTITSNISTGCGGSGCRRFLFRRGDTFTGSGATYTTAGPVHIGAYGTGAKPIISNSGNLFNVNASDWRFVDVKLSPGDTTDAASIASSAQNVTNILALRVDCADGQCMHFSGGSLSAFTSGMWDGLFAFDSTCDSPITTTGNGDNCFYMTGYRVAMVGNSCDMDLGSEHCFRTYAQRVVESHNTCAQIPAGRACITNRSFLWTAEDGHPAETYSGTAVISFNIEDSSNVDGGIGYGPTNKDFDERCKDIIIESNFSYVRYTGACPDNFTIRNNINDFATNGVGVQYDPPSPDFGLQPGMPPRTRFYIRSNTTFGRGTGDTQGFTLTGAYAGYDYTLWTTWYQNNLVIAPNDTSGDDSVVYIDPAYPITLTQATNTNGSGQKRTNPLSTSNPTTYLHYRPTTSSYPDGAGSAIPVYDDFFGNFRPSNDMGAIVIP